MTPSERDILPQLRNALQRHGCRINSRTGLEQCKAEVEKVLGKPLSHTPAALTKELNAFLLRGISHGMPVRPFVELTQNHHDMMCHWKLAEACR